MAGIQRLRKLGLCFTLGLLALVLADQFMGEFLALVWHVRHGKTARLQAYDGRKYAVEVPLLWLANADDNGWSVFMSKTGSMRHPFRRRSWSTMSFSVSPMYNTAEELRRPRSPIQIKIGLKVTEIAAFTAAGQDVYCFDQQFTRDRLASPGIATVNLECVPLSDKRFFSASYSGSPEFVPEFYGVLKSVRRLE